MTSAAARNGAALDRSGSTTASTALIGPGATAHRFGFGVVDGHAAQPQLRHGHLHVRQRRHRLAAVPYVDAGVVPRAGQQQGGDELAGRRRVQLDHAAGHRPRAPHGQRQPAAPVVVDHDPQRAQRRRPSGPSAAAAPAGRRRGVPARPPARRPAARTASRCRPGRSRRSPDRARAAGVTRQSSPSASMRAPSERRASAISWVSRARSGRTSVEGPSASAASTSSPVGERLAARQRHGGVDGGGGHGRRPPRGRDGHAVVTRSVRSGRDGALDPPRRQLDPFAGGRVQVDGGDAAARRSSRRS